MSVRVMAWVWDKGLGNGAERLVLLALADFCDDAGRCWPAMATIAAKACVTERGARNIVRRLEADGWLQTKVGRGRGGCNTYQILMSNPEQRSGNEVPRMAFRPERDDTLPGTVLPFNRNAGSAEPSRTTKDPSSAERKAKAEAFGATPKGAKGALRPGSVQSEPAGAVLPTNPATDAPRRVIPLAWFLPAAKRMRGGAARCFASEWLFHRGIHLMKNAKLKQYISCD